MIFEVAKYENIYCFWGGVSQVGLNIYPNPVTGVSQIQVTLPDKQNAIIKIYDIQGRIVQQYNLKNKAGIINISNTELKAGIYNVVLFDNGVNIDSKKIIVK